MGTYPVTCTITATKGRHSCVERLIRMMLDQTYTGKLYHLIYNNSCSDQRLNENISKERVILVNNCMDLVTGKRYDTLGAIYRDCMTFIPEDVEVVNFADDDDYFLPNHIEEGVKGLLKSGKKAYKPKKSYFLNGNKVSLLENTLEPSIFVKKEALMKYGYSLTTSDQHLAWVDGLLGEREIVSDPEGKPTLVYTWGQEAIFKTSGNAGNVNNFKNYETMSRDEGDFIITPASKKYVDNLLSKIKPT